MMDHKTIQCFNQFIAFSQSHGVTETIIALKSGGLSDEIIKPPSTSGNRPASKLK